MRQPFRELRELGMRARGLFFVMRRTTSVVVPAGFLPWHVQSARFYGAVALGLSILAGLLWRYVVRERRTATMMKVLPVMDSTRGAWSADNAEEVSSSEAAPYRILLHDADLKLWEWDVSSGRTSLSDPFQPERLTITGCFQLPIFPDGSLDAEAELSGRAAVENVLAGASDRFQWDLAAPSPNDPGKPAGWRRIVGLVVERDTQGRAIRCTGYCQDITNLKKMSERLRRFELCGQLVAQGGRLGFWTCDRREPRPEFSRSLGELYGVDLDEVLDIESFWLENIHPDHREHVLRQWEAFISGQAATYETEYPFRYADGGWRWCLTRAQATDRDAEGRVKRVIGMQMDITERKQAQLAVEEAERRYRETLDAVQQAIWDWDVASDHVIRNEAFFTMLGHRREDFAPDYRGWAEFVHPDDLTTANQAIATTLREGAPFEAEYRMRHADGSWRWILSLGRVVRWNDDGSAARMIGTQTDITRLKETEAALRDSETLFRAVFDGSADPVFVVDLATQRFRMVNNAATELFGYSREEFITMGPLDISDEPEETLRALREKKPTTVDRRMRCKRGRRFIGELTIRIIPLGGSSAMICNIRDVTERRRIEQALQEANVKLRNYSDDLEEMVRQRAARLAEKNTALRATLDHLRSTQSKLVQAEKMASVGHLMAGIMHEINTPLGAMQAATGIIESAAQRVIGRFQELSALLPDAFRPHAMALLDLARRQEPDCRASAVRRELRNGVEASLLEHGIQDARAMADTLVDMSLEGHWEPLLPLLQSADGREAIRLLRDVFYILRSARIMSVASTRAAETVRALKNYVHRDSSGRPQLASPRDSVETVLKLFHNKLKQGFDLLTRFEPAPPILCFPDQLCHVWTNLIDNAIDAMGGSGLLTVAIRPHDEGVLVSFADTGHGIDPAVRDRIFDPFFTTKRTGEGSGLGLDIVQTIIANHRGRIEVESSPGCGATFHVWLPARPSHGQEPSSTGDDTDPADLAVG